jgi:hypothetical protein
LDVGRKNLNNVNKNLTDEEIISIQNRMSIIEEEEKEDCDLLSLMLK